MPKLISFTTETGSRYEVVPECKTIRRLDGNKPPTYNQGPDGQFQVYTHIDDIVLGEQILINWNNDVKSTRTSRVAKITESDI